MVAAADPVNVTVPERATNADVPALLVQLPVVVMP